MLEDFAVVLSVVTVAWLSFASYPESRGEEVTSDLDLAMVGLEMIVDEAVGENLAVALAFVVGLVGSAVVGSVGCEYA